MPNTPPNPPFSINWDSPQAQGLVFWAPFGRVAGEERDVVQGRLMTNVASTPLITSPLMGIVPSFNGSSQYYWSNLPEVYEEPIGLWGRAFPNNVTTSGHFVCLGNNGSGGFYCISLDGAATGDPARAIKQNTAGTAAIAESTTGFVASQWHTVLGTFDTTTSRTVWLNGGSSATNTTSITAASPDFISVGTLLRSTASSFLNGLVQDARVYTRRMTDVDAAIMNDPRTTFDLWYPLRRKIWSFASPAAAGGTRIWQLAPTGSSPTVAGSIWELATV